jgi:hypothetical protein
VINEVGGLRAPSFRVQTLLNLRGDGTLTIQEFAVRLKDFSSQEIADLVQCILNRVKFPGS